MSILPMVLCVVLQLLVGAVVMGIYGVVMSMGELRGSSPPQVEQLQRMIKEYAIQGVGPGIFAYHLVGVGVFGLWCYRLCFRNREPRRKMFSVPSGKAVGAAIFFGLFLCMFSTQVVEMGSWFFPETMEAFYEMMERGFGKGIWTLLAAVLLAPIGEEFLCRGVIQYYAGKMTNRFWIANGMQALLFAVIHMNLVQGFYAFCIGLVLGWTRRRYDSLVVPILIHFVANFSSTFFMGTLLEKLPDSIWIDGSMLLLAVFAVGAGIKRLGEVNVMSPTRSFVQKKASEGKET